MFKASESRTYGNDQRVLVVLAIALTVMIFVITWVSIRQSRVRSYELLQAQGTAFTEALAQASENAIVAETYYDNLVQARYSDLVATLLDMNIDRLTDQEWVSFVLAHDLEGLYVFESDSGLVIEVGARSPRSSLPEFVVEEVAQLFTDPESNFILLLDENESTGGMVQYYLELTSRLDLVVVLAVDALYYSEALRQTGIGYLAQNMAREKGVEYIIYQSTEGIIFASRKPGDLLAIESDPFLSEALDSDTIMSRVFEFQDKNVLELVRPFSTSRFPFGLFRVGLSLDGYYAVSRGFDQMMIILSGTLLVLLLVALLYLSGRRKRQELSHRYSDIKSVTDKLFEQMRTGVAAIDGEGVVRMANRAFENIFGIEGLAGRSWSEVFKSQCGLLEDFMTQSTSADETEVIINIGGAERRLLVARSKLHDDPKEKPAVVMVAYDITRLRKYEQQAQRKERLSEMGNLAAGVAHEIRNPLNTISIAVQRLASEFLPEENSDEYVAFTNQIRTETSRLNDIITRFLALTREDRKQFRKVRLDELLHEMGALLKVEGDKLGLMVSIETDSDLTVEADPNRLKQVFLNLFNNAKEALNGKSGKIIIEAKHNGDRLEVTFTDTGPGIPVESADKVFTPYFTTKEAGTGLGLPTVERIVSELGGEIYLDLTYTDGARFVISLPVR